MTASSEDLEHEIWVLRAGSDCQPDEAPHEGWTGASGDVHFQLVNQSLWQASGDFGLKHFCLPRGSEPKPEEAGWALSARLEGLLEDVPGLAGVVLLDCHQSPQGQPNQGVTTSTQNTATNISVANFRKWIVPIEQYMEKMSDLYVVMCPTLWNKLRAELEAKGQLELNKDKLRFGIQQFEIDGAQIVKDPYLEKGWGSSGTTENWVFILNMADWELRIHSARNFKQTEFEWQGDQANGHDDWLARIMLAGNLMCWKPNGNLWLSNVMLEGLRRHPFGQGRWPQPRAGSKFRRVVSF
jgi:hypothetical protein